MKFTRKTIVILEMDEHEHEVVMDCVAIAAVGDQPSKRLRTEATRLMNAYRDEVRRFDDHQAIA
jgi:hypothetical protein